MKFERSLISFPLMAAIGVGIFVLDFVSKILTHHYLPLAHQFFYSSDYPGILLFNDLFGGVDLYLTHIGNRGAAWSLLAEWQVPLLFLRIFFICGLFLYLLKGNSPREWKLPIICILAGAVGNVLDYFLYGHVIDMIHFVFWGYQYPIFNIADISIFLGTLLWILHSRKKQPTYTPNSS